MSRLLLSAVDLVQGIAHIVKSLSFLQDLFVAIGFFSVVAAVRVTQALLLVLIF